MLIDALPLNLDPINWYPLIERLEMSKPFSSEFSSWILNGDYCSGLGLMSGHWLMSLESFCDEYRLVVGLLERKIELPHRLSSGLLSLTSLTAC